MRRLLAGLAGQDRACAMALEILLLLFSTQEEPRIRLIQPKRNYESRNPTSGDGGSGMQVVSSCQFCEFAITN